MVRPNALRARLNEGRPAFVDAMTRAEKSILGGDVWYGSVSSMGRDVAERVAAGARFLCPTSDQRFLIGGGQAAVAAFRDV